MKSLILLTTLSIIVLIIPQKIFCQNLNPSNNKVRMADIDTISYISIDKLIYYQNPLVLEYNSLIDKEYVPIWYKPYCANANYEYFKDYPKEAAGLFQSISGVTEEKLSEYLKKTKAKGSLKDNLLLPFTYIFGEIWITYRKTGEQIIYTQSYESEKTIPKLEFREPVVKKNLLNEKTDSIKELSGSITSYIYENGILKRANQPIVWKGMICNNSKYMISGSLNSFKDILFRAPRYIRSVVKDGKRVFETIENTKEGPVVKSVSDKL